MLVKLFLARPVGEHLICQNDLVSGYSRAVGGDGSPELKAVASADLEPDATGQDSLLDLNS